MEDVTVSPVPAPTNFTKFENEGFAWFKFVFGVVYMGFGFFCLVVFFRARNVFEIRARSVYLVTTLGLLLLMYQGINVDLHAIILFNAPAHYFTNNMLVHFLTFSIASCYICRITSLAVGFNPRLRRALPKLMNEKLLVSVSLLVGLLSLTIPVYYKISIPDNDEYQAHQKGSKWVSTLVLQIIQFCLLPVVWFIDDLFHISRELMVIIVIGLIQSVSVKLYIEGNLGAAASEVVNPPNMQLLATSILFGLSIVDPVRRLKFSPMAKSSAAMARAAAKNAAAKARRKASSSRPNRSNRHRRGDGSGDSMGDSIGSSGAYSQHMWNYDKIAVNEPVMKAFRAYANRALCQESVWFLEEVSRYQNGDFTITSPLGGGRVEAFEAITKRFIAEGAPDEVNLSYKDRKNILNMYNKGGGSFEYLDDELSGVFDRAYSEIRFMIESNILHKFTETDEFRHAANTLPAHRPAKHCCFFQC